MTDTTYSKSFWHGLVRALLIGGAYPLIVIVASLLVVVVLFGLPGAYPTIIGLIALVLVEETAKALMAIKFQDERAWVWLIAAAPIALFETILKLWSALSRLGLPSLEIAIPYYTVNAANFSIHFSAFVALGVATARNRKAIIFVLPMCIAFHTINNLLGGDVARWNEQPWRGAVYVLNALAFVAFALVIVLRPNALGQSRGAVTPTSDR